MVQLVKDIWRPAIVAAPIAQVAVPGALDDAALHWFPDQGSLRFLADPFGCWRDGMLHVFAEFFDYRDAHGRIDVCVFDAALRLVEQRMVLREPWHLSYPYVFEAEGETWMLPEAYQSGGLTLYRATGFPFSWTPVHRIMLDHVPLDATPVFHDGLWWLFYAPAWPTGERLTTLRLAWAERLAGPWRDHADDVVWRDAAGARPGGTPFVRDGRLVLPVQDASGGYGCATRLLEITELSPTRFAATMGARLVAPASLAPFDRGLHTLSAAGDVTLIDVKRGVLSWEGVTMRPRREWRRWRAQLASGAQASGA